MHLGATAEPLVGPGINKQPAAARCEGRAHLPVQHRRLLRLAVAQTVQPEFGHDQGPIPGDGVQAAQVGFEAFLRFQVDVKANKIQKRQLQVLGGRIIDIGDQTLRVLLFRGARHLFEEPLDAAAPLPSDDGGWDFVAQGVTEHGRMAGTGTNLFAHHAFDRLDAFRVIQKGGRTFDRQAHQHEQPVFLRGIEQPTRRRRVSAHRVDAVVPHLGQIAFDTVASRKLVPLGVRPERSVSDAANEEFFVADEDKFSAHMGPHIRPPGGANHRLRERWCEYPAQPRRVGGQRREGSRHHKRLGNRRFIPSYPDCHLAVTVVAAFCDTECGRHF